LCNQCTEHDGEGGHLEGILFLGFKALLQLSHGWKSSLATSWEGRLKHELAWHIVIDAYGEGSITESILAFLIVFVFVVTVEGWCRLWQLTRLKVNPIQENFNKEKKKRITFPLRHYFPLKIVPLIEVLL
jgi:hypothetical protein